MSDLAPLRHADWRWLLPRPADGAFEHLVLWGGPEALVKRLLADGIARRISCIDPGRGEADAVVVLHGSGPVPEPTRIAAMLCPGGVVYCELDRRALPDSFGRSPAALGEALAEAGLTGTGIYWVQPSFRTRQTYVPIDRTQALRWYLRTSAAPSGRLEWLRTLTQRAMLPVRRTAALRLVRRYAFTAVAGAEPVPPILASLVQQALPQESRTGPIHAVVVTNGADDLDRVVVLPFSEQDGVPRAVVKFPRVAERNFLVEAEHRALAELSSLLDEATRDALSRSLGLTRWEDVSVGAESYVEGRSMAATSRSRVRSVRRKQQDFRLAAEWLTAFHLQAEVERRTWSESDWDEHVTQPLRTYGDAVGLTADEARLFEAAQGRKPALLGTRLPIVWQHYAYAPWNLARDGDRIRVFDWEGAAPGLPLVDLWYFAMHWHFDVVGARSESARREAFRSLAGGPTGADSVCAPIERAIRAYVTRLGMHPAYRSLALLLLVVTRAISSFERDRDAASEPDRSTNPRVAYVEVLAGCRTHLFSELGSNG